MRDISVVAFGRFVDVRVGTSAWTLTRGELAELIRQSEIELDAEAKPAAMGGE